jgi:hypothetical protein
MRNYHQQHIRYIDEIWYNNELFGRALQIIQDEEYLDDVDFDEIKRRKRQSPFTKNQSEDKMISETMEAFKDDLNLNEIVETSKILIHRGKRQMMVNTTLNSLKSALFFVASFESEQEKSQVFKKAK